MNDQRSNKRMLYIMHVSWFWIKQRPHFIAENLNGHFNLTVLYPESFRRNKQLQQIKNPPFVSSYKTLPLQRFRNNKIFYFLNSLFIKLQISRKIIHNEYIWITAPTDYALIKKFIKQSQIIIYDCMDDFLEFPTIKSSSKSSSKCFFSEQELINRANFVFVSSQHLKEKLKVRYTIKKDIKVINNAITDTFSNQKYTEKDVVYPNKNGFIDLIYIGTISDWFDFNLLLQSLEEFKNIRYILLGPTERAIPKHNQIIHLGPKKHDELQAYMQKADALIMPFIVNDLIKSVNPVKLYEYIYSGKPIITCSYSEIDQFNDFVYRYDSEEDCFLLLKKLIANELMQKDIAVCQEFTFQNTWRKRIEIIMTTLNINIK